MPEALRTWEVTEVEIHVHGEPIDAVRAERLRGFYLSGDISWLSET